MISDYEPFSKSNLSKIFRIDPLVPNRLISRESSTLEFKANFHHGREFDRYAKTMAAFANNKGGYIIFGINDKPRTLTGMTNNKFINFDSQALTQFLNKTFSPEIKWDPYTYYVETKEFGLIYVFENIEKPVIAISNGKADIKEGDIYYRYRGTTERIKYPELKSIIEEQKQKIHNTWYKQISKIAKIGVEDAAIFDPTSGIVSGKAGNFIIDKALLPKLRFIKEGEFKEITGAPTIRVVGEAQVLSAGDIKAERTKIETRVIHSPDILISFLRQLKLPNPEDHLYEICYGTTPYLPVYYFIDQANIAIDKAIEEIKHVQHCNSGTQNRLIERLIQNDPRIHYKIAVNDTPATQKKLYLWRELISGRISKEIPLSDTTALFNVIQTLGKDEIDIDYLFPLMLYFFENRWKEFNQTSKTTFRKAVCHLDFELYRGKIAENV